MRFALLGDHPDGLDLARALAASGAHDVSVYCGPAMGLHSLQHHGVSPRVLEDVEEVLADPEIDAVIVASDLPMRRRHLLRALQAESHVFCVHPADISPDVAYEASLIQADTGRVLLPLLPMAFHPGFERLRQMAQKQPLPRMLEMEIWSTEEVLIAWTPTNSKPSLPGWEVLRVIGGEIGEVFLQSTRTELSPGEPLTVSGRFASGLLFHANFMPRQAHAHARLSLVTTTGRASLHFAHGWPGPARLAYTDEEGQSRTESWDTINPWPALIQHFELAVLDGSVRRPQPGQPDDANLTKNPPHLGWPDALRALELDDAARRSLERGRASTLDLQEVTEEASFKGTMTLVGCSLIWLAVVVLIVSIWIPWLAWGILPVFAIFLGLQALRWVLPEKDERAPKANG